MGHRFTDELRTAEAPRSRAALVAAGHTIGRLRGPGWRRVDHGRYVVATAETTPAQRILTAAAALPDGGAVTGWAAAYSLGVDWLDGHPDDPVDLAVGPTVHRRRRAGIRWHRQPPGPVRHVAGVPVVSGDRAILDAARSAQTLPDAVTAIDAGLACGLTDLERLSVLLVAAAGRPGIRRLRQAVRLARPGVESPRETWLRLLACDAGVTDLLVNVPVFDRHGRFLGRPDLFDPTAALALEYDGAGHRDAHRHHADNVREERFESANVTMVRVDGIDAAHHVEQARARIRDGWRRGLARERRRDQWTLTPPELTSAELGELILDLE